jgi:UDP-N-acetylglucosamine acyltransferase
VIHQTAIIGKEVELADGVEVGPYSIIEGKVKIGKGTRVGPHVVIRGHTEIGEGNQIFQFSSIGEVPQDLKYKGEDTLLKIGDRNIIREYVTIHPGTVTGHGKTTVGSGCMLMIGVHIAHDCIVGNGVVMANVSSLSGHVTIEDFCILGGMSGIHQFARIGSMAFVGGGSMVGMDVPPFCTASGYRSKLFGLNSIGMRRRGMSNETISKVKRAYKIILEESTLMKEGLKKAAEEFKDCKEVMQFVDFIRKSERGVCKASGRDTGEEGTF